MTAPARRRPVRRELTLILAAEARIRRVPAGRWALAVSSEQAGLLAAGEDPWLAEHVTYCLEERLLNRNKAQGCAARLAEPNRVLGDHECIAEALHPGPHRCACGWIWARC